MDKNKKDKICQTIVQILQEYNVASIDKYEAMDEEIVSELYESLKAGVLEEFKLSYEELEEIFDEVLEGL
ncbi:hypothetical protein U5B43_04080 [Campylobacter sp. 9BO]|uniref:hypothetical protein n=1 Tax=Campylobacter sp. 9BO TaxID=3424759 RepID=UPI003D3400C4